MILETPKLPTNEYEERSRCIYEKLARTPVRDLIAKGIALSELKGLLNSQHTFWPPLDRIEQLLDKRRPEHKHRWIYRIDEDTERAYLTCDDCHEVRNSVNEIFPQG